MSDEIEITGTATDVTPGGIWPFMPGDRVLCLVPVTDGEQMLSGTVERIVIPGPMSPHKVVQVTLDEDLPIDQPGVRVLWFDPDRLERITSG